MHEAYKGSAVGFLRDAAADDPPPQRGSASAATTIPYRREFHETLFAEGYASGLSLVRDCLTARRSVAADIAMLLKASQEARGGPQSNHAVGRFCGYLAELDRTLTALFAAGVQITAPPIDEFSVAASLKRTPAAS